MAIKAANKVLSPPPPAELKIEKNYQLNRETRANYQFGWKNAHENCPFWIGRYLLTGVLLLF